MFWFFIYSFSWTFTNTSYKIPGMQKALTAENEPKKSLKTLPKVTREHARAAGCELCGTSCTHHACLHVARAGSSSRGFIYCSTSSFFLWRSCVPVNGRLHWIVQWDTWLFNVAASHNRRTNQRRYYKSLFRSGEMADVARVYCLVNTPLLSWEGPMLRDGSLKVL